MAEINALEHKPMYMSDHINQLDRILSSGDRKLLDGPGSISNKQAIEKATKEYRQYQANTLSPVEKEYLESLKHVFKEAKKNK